MLFRLHLSRLIRLGRRAPSGQLPSRGYLVCSLERTGSGLFAEALRRTGLAGQPMEYFNRRFMQNNPTVQQILHGLDAVEGLPEILKAGSTPNGVFGAKIHMGHFYELGLGALGQKQQAPERRAEELLRTGLPQLMPIGASLAALREDVRDLGWQDAAYQLLG